MLETVISSKDFISLQDVLKTSWRRLQRNLPRRIEDVLQNIFKVFSRGIARREIVTL